MSDIAAELQTALGSNYTIERPLIGGGMSRVFLARDQQLARQVVVKVLPPSLAERVSLERFQREILTLAGLQHPHIVPIISAGEFDGLPYFIMPYVEGESLRARLLRGPMSLRESVTIMRDVARALAFAHEKGIVHRDIKPDNILLAGGSATVTDFGVAKAITAAGRTTTASGGSNITESGISLGTPTYMAPEQVAADPGIDHRADLYALGVVAYEMLIGTPPFHGRTRQAIMTAHLAETPPAVNQRRSDVSDVYSALISQCLEKAPGSRPRNAALVARTLDDPEIMAAPMPSSASVKRRVVNGVGAIVAIAALAAAAWYFQLFG